MKQYMSNTGAWFRGILVTIGAVITFLLSDDYFRTSAAPWLLTALGAVAVAVLTIRQFADQSITQAQDGATPVEVTAPEGEPLETVDVEPHESK